MSALWRPDDDLRSALVVVAHPDDIDFGGAGTVAVMTRSGMTVSYCIVTDGQSGTSDPLAKPDELGARRRDEQRAAAKAVGVDEVIFLGHRDGRVVADLSLRRDISRVIRQVRPDVVLTASPQRNFDRIFASHPDHLATGEAAMCASYPDARDPHAHPELLRQEGLEPHQVREVWLMSHPDVDLYVDITDNFEAKVAALREHVSQVGERDDLDGLLREWASANAERAGLPQGRLAESFRVVAIG